VCSKNDGEEKFLRALRRAAVDGAGNGR
jgi:hypothetical protein